MKHSTYTSYDELPLMLSVAEVAAVLGISRAGAYELVHARLPHIRFHDLRHTFATLALQNGVDVKTVSSMLGHYDAGFTLRTYTHATRQKQDEAAQTMGSFMAQVM